MIDYRFIPVNAESNSQYLDDIITLFCKYSDDWVNDYWQKGKYIAAFLKELLSAFPWFLAVINSKNEFMGFVYLLRWEGKAGCYHSVQIQGMMKKEFQGKETEKAFICLLDWLFSLKLQRIQMEIPESNTMACSLAERMEFCLEGTIRNASIKDGILRNHKLYSILKEDYEHGKR